MKKKISDCQNNSKIKYQHLRKWQNRYSKHTNTWLLTFMAWHRHFNNNWWG